MARGLVGAGIGVVVLLGFLYYQVLPFFNKLIVADPQHAFILKPIEIILLGAPTVILPIWVIDRYYQEENAPVIESPKELEQFGFGFGFLKPNVRWILSEAAKQGAVDLVRKDEGMKETSLSLEGKIAGVFLPADVNGVPYIHVGTGKEFKIDLNEKQAKKASAIMRETKVAV